MKVLLQCLCCRQLLDQLAPMDAVVMPGVEDLLKRMDMGEQVSQHHRTVTRTEPAQLVTVCDSAEFGQIFRSARFNCQPPV